MGGSASDFVGSNGVTELANGSFLIRSVSWDNGTATNAGAVTLASGTSGKSGIVSAANSLVGGSANDNVGFMAPTALLNGNYVVVSPS